MATPLPAVNVVQNFRDAWELLQQRLAPGRLAESDANIVALRTQVAKKYKMESVQAAAPQQIADVLYEAVEALYFNGVLQWEKTSQAFHQKMVMKRQQEFEAKERARVEREKLKNSKPFDTGGKHAEAQKAKDAEEKRQKIAQAQINFLIETYSVNASYPGAIDQSKTEAGRAALRGIRIHHQGKYDAVLTLKVLQQAYLHETPEAIIRAAERETNRLDLVANPTERPRRDSLGVL